MTAVAAILALSAAIVCVLGKRRSHGRYSAR